MKSYGRAVLLVGMIVGLWGVLAGCGTGGAATAVITAAAVTEDAPEVIEEEPAAIEEEPEPTEEPEAADENLPQVSATQSVTEEPSEEPAGDSSTGLPTLPVAVFTVNEGEEAGDEVWVWRPGGVPGLLAGGDSIVDKLLLSPDGAVAVFERRQFERPQTSTLWAVNTDGSNERELLNVDDLLGMMKHEGGFGSNLTDMDFLPDSHTLVFSTQTRIEAPGVYSNQDLWLLDIDTGELTALQEDGPGRQQDFSISPDGTQIAVITDGAISVVAVDGSGRTGNLLDYAAAPVSDFSQLAVVGWTADSTSLVAVLPPEDIFAEPPLPHHVVHIPIDGSPRGEVAQFFGSGLFGATFNAGGSAFVYFEGVGEGETAGTALHIVNEGGTNDVVLLTAAGLRPRVWDSDGVHYFTFNLDEALLYVAGVGEEGMLVEGPVYNGEDWLRDSIGLIGDDTVLYVAYTEDRSTYALWQVTYGSEPSVVMVLNGQPGTFIPKVQVER